MNARGMRPLPGSVEHFHSIDFRLLWFPSVQCEHRWTMFSKHFIFGISYTALSLHLSLFLSVPWVLYLQSLHYIKCRYERKPTRKQDHAAAVQKANTTMFNENFRNSERCEKHWNIYVYIISCMKYGADGGWYDEWEKLGVGKNDNDVGNKNEF